MAGEKTHNSSLLVLVGFLQQHRLKPQLYSLFHISIQKTRKKKKKKKNLSVLFIFGEKSKINFLSLFCFGMWHRYLIHGSWFIQSSSAPWKIVRAHTPPHHSVHPESDRVLPSVLAVSFPYRAALGRSPGATRWTCGYSFVSPLAPFTYFFSLSRSLSLSPCVLEAGVS